VKVTASLSATATQPLTLTILAANLVLNGGFETGNFSSWMTSGNLADTFVTTGSQYAHSGTYGAQLGPSGSLGYLSQTLATTAGTSYLLSFWLDSPDGKTPNEFLVSWNGTNLFDQVNLGTTGWTNLQFTVTATGSNTTLEFGFRNDPSYFGLDDISVNAISAPLLLLSSAGFNTNGEFQLSINGQIGQAYTLQASTNLMSWVNILNFTYTNPPMYVVDPQVNNYSCRFYRIAQGTLLVSVSPVVLGFGLPQPWTANGLALVLQGPVGSKYVIQASTNLLNWIPITNFVSTNSSFYFNDQQTTNYDQRFYRAIMQ
jgi:hypothetical protein